MSLPAPGWVFFSPSFGRAGVSDRRTDGRTGLLHAGRTPFNYEPFDPN